MKYKLLAILVVFLTISGCANHFEPETFASPYGFFYGIWHGVLFPISVLANFVSWLLSLVDISFLEDIKIIGRPNTGFWYCLGFVLGLSADGLASSGN